MAAKLAEHGSIRRGYLGIRSQVVEIPETAFETLAREQKSGLLLVAFENESPAAESDLMVGDIIVGIGGEAIADHDELATKLTGEVVGQVAAVNVLRVGELLTIDVIVGERQMHYRGRHKRRAGKRDTRRYGRRGRKSRHHGNHHP
jgi:S1-C subfamily serine protease